jgi:hypothetical protein
MMRTSLCFSFLLFSFEAVAGLYTNDFVKTEEYNPPLNPSLYEVDTLAFEQSAFPFGGNLPLERVHHSIDVNSDFLMVYGGYSKNGTILGDINLYHISSQSWSNPIIRLECCNQDGNVVDTIGADENINFPYLRPGFQGDFPLPRAEHASCVINEEMFVFGGVTAEYGYMNDIYKFNTKTLKWTVLDHLSGTQIPRRRAGHSFLSNPSTNECILFGGRANSTSGNGHAVGLYDIWSFDTTTRSWKRIDYPNVNSLTHPFGRQHVASMIMNGDVYLFGGDDPASGLYYQDIWVFHLKDKKYYWERIQPSLSGGMIHQFAPPPLAHAHLLPSLCQDDDTTDFQNCGGFLIYGGLGSGGFCGTRNGCNAQQVSLGQVYLYSFKRESWVSPFEDLTMNALPESTQSNWLYARLSSAPFIPPSPSSASGSTPPANLRFSAQTRQYFGKYLKTYAMEKIIFIPKRRIFYEFGGVQAINNLYVMDAQENKLFVSQTTDQNRFDSSFPPFPDGLHSTVVETVQPIFLDVGGGLPSTLSDVQTGEQLRVQVDLPSNSFWDFRNSWNRQQGSSSSSSPIEYLRSFRKFSPSARDIVLLQEDNYE